MRVAVPNKSTVSLIGRLKDQPSVPVVADIHFDYKLALECVAAGADKIRINPGNIGEASRVEAVCKACMKAEIPIRVGVNSGSLEKELLHQYGAPTPEALTESAMRNVALLERYGFEDIIVSIKASSLATKIAANRLISARMQYPLHLGVTEACTERMGLIKSAIGLVPCLPMVSVIRSAFPLQAIPFMRFKPQRIFCVPLENPVTEWKSFRARHADERILMLWDYQKKLKSIFQTEKKA